MNFQHRFVASLVVMSFVIFILSLATRNLSQSMRDSAGPELTEFELTVPDVENLAEIVLPDLADLAPLDDPMNVAVVVAVGLTKNCLADIEYEYFIPIEVRLDTDGVRQARIQAVAEDVDGRLDCIAAGLWATEWPPVHGAPPWIQFSVPPTSGIGAG